MNGEDYIQIKPDFFLKGMYIDSDIFYVQNGKAVLFCQQAIITEEKINKLKAISESNAPIFVSKQGYIFLMQQYESIKNINEEQAKNYRKTKDMFAKQAEEIRRTGKVDTKQSEMLADMVNETLDRAELSYIVQWVSYMRDTDEYLCTHSVNVSMLNGMMGKWLGLSTEEEKKLVLAGLLHDIGKVKIAEEIINKPGKLTKEEYEIVKRHPLFSYDILMSSGIKDEEILSGARGHHEKGNGSGYPDGLVLDKISLFARVTAISDIYDAMVAKRAYKDACSPFQVLDEFYKNKFSDLDIRLVDIFLDRMANDMIGRDAVLSDGRMGKIVFIDKDNIAYPVVKSGDEIIYTTFNLRCEALCTGIR